MKRIISLISLAFVFVTLNAQESFEQKAEATLEAIHKLYDTGYGLLNENCPKQKKDNECSFLWPLSSVVSGSLAYAETQGKKAVCKVMDSTIIPALNRYHDTSRQPTAYASYINTTSSDRYYDDNIWLGLDFADAYLFTHEKRYLQIAKEIWAFVESGTDDVLGGGVYWCEQKRTSKNTCSNAPAAVLALKLYLATKDKNYLQKGEAIYQWTKSHLQDPNDLIYWDNVNLEGNVQKWKFAYNSGQMLQAVSLLYQITRNKEYLHEAQALAEATYKHFFSGGEATIGGETFPLISKGNIWFTAIMLRGFIQLYKSTKDNRYLHAFSLNLTYAWTHMRDPETGLFSQDWSGHEKETVHPLLTQGAMLEMYSRLTK